MKIEYLPAAGTIWWQSNGNGSEYQRSRANGNRMAGEMAGDSTHVAFFSKAVVISAMARGAQTTNHTEPNAIFNGIATDLR